MIKNDLCPCERCSNTTDDPYIVSVRDANTGKLIHQRVCKDCFNEHDWSCEDQPFKDRAESELWKKVAFGLKKLNSAIAGNQQALDQVEKILDLLDEYFTHSKCRQRATDR